MMGSYGTMAASEPDAGQDVARAASWPARNESIPGWSRARPPGPKPSSKKWPSVPPAAVLIAVRQVLLEELREEQSVQVPGLGHFTLSLKGELDEDVRLVPQSARLKINCRPERSLTEKTNAEQTYQYVAD
jgi:hypothetical protein